MAKRTVRVKIEIYRPQKFIHLLKRVAAQHDSLGASSPFASGDVVDMNDFKLKLQQAVVLREESEELRELAVAKMEEANRLLGIAKGQNIQTEGTLYYLVDVVRKFLLTKYKGFEESLSPFGFNVVVGTAKGIGRKKKNK